MRERFERERERERETADNTQKIPFCAPPPRSKTRRHPRRPRLLWWERNNKQNDSTPTFFLPTNHVPLKNVFFARALLFSLRSKNTLTSIYLHKNFQRSRSCTRDLVRVRREKEKREREREREVKKLSLLTKKRKATNDEKTKSLSLFLFVWLLILVVFFSFQLTLTLFTYDANGESKTGKQTSSNRTKKQKWRGHQSKALVKILREKKFFSFFLFFPLLSKKKKTRGDDNLSLLSLLSLSLFSTTRQSASSPAGTAEDPQRPLPEQRWPPGQRVPASPCWPPCESAAPSSALRAWPRRRRKRSA